VAPSATEVRAYRHGLYERGTLTGDDGEVPVLPHGLPKVDSDGIAALVAAEQARTTLEVGAGVGVGTLAICEALLAGPGGDHTVVDPYAFGGDVAVYALRAAGVEGMVTRLREPSQLALPRMVAEERRFDLILVDGGHRFDDVFLDLVYADRLLEPGHVVVIDDLWMPAIRAATSYIERNLGYELEPDALPEGFRRRRGRSATGRVAVLRKPLVERERGWDDYQGFDS
jgi:predicted O-methyltransferase YrrM